MSIGKTEIVLLLGNDSRYILKNILLKLIGKQITPIVPQRVKDSRMTQFPVNSSIIATGFTLQGQTKQYMIIGTWNYIC